MQKFIINITKPEFDLLDDSQIECFIVSPILPTDFLDEFVSKARQKNKLLLSNDKALCLEHRLDGVIFDFSKSENPTADYQNATQNLKGLIIGAVSRGRRHEAMIISECEPDFIIFRAWQDGADKIKELTDWYNEFFLIQSALLPVDDQPDFSDFKTDFVILNDIKYKNLIAK